MSRKFACLYLAVALLVSSIWIASADERDTVQQEVQYSAAVEALDAAGLTSRSSNVLPSGEGLALALELGLPVIVVVNKIDRKEPARKKCSTKSTICSSILRG